MEEEYNYGFLDYNYYGEYSNDPLYILIGNEQYNIIRNSFYDLDENIRNVLDYFVIQRNGIGNINIDEYLQQLKYKYLKNYNQN